MNINDCLSQIVSLTKQNVAILTALNDSFHTRRNHVAVNIDGDTYAIPSFLSLENKIDILTQDLENILNAPKTGEAFTYFDGTTQRLELGGYASTPTHVDLSAVSKFNVETNNVFKDFMSPSPYVRLNIESIPNNIKHVNVKKIALNNSELRELVDQSTGASEDNASVNVSYPDLYKILYNFEKDVDYTEYDTVRRLPIRQGNAYGYYEIVSIADEYQDSNFEEHYELLLDRDLTYTINNGTIQRDIKVGDSLVTNNDKVQMLVEAVHPVSRTIKVKIMYGGYANLCDQTSNNADLYKLKFYKTADYESTKYINVPLEEDRYVIVFIAPLNDTTNVQAPWGTGLYINTDLLQDDNGVSFREYYNRYVNNIGDSLYAITHMMDDDAQIEKLSVASFNELREFKPTIVNDDASNITVTQINKHLNDSKSVQAIRRLYSQKAQYKNELDTTQASIDKINETLATISFDDTNNTRTVFENQLSELNSKKRELTASISSIVAEIAENANDSDVPIENAKYHIRGFIDTTNVPEAAKVIKLDVEYRYKNKSKFTGNAETIGDSYIYSDWNKMDSVYRRLRPGYENHSYVYSLDVENDNINEISFNQIDIPISQGETVDIRVRFIYNLGYPFIEFTSAWSDIYNQSFPEEFLANVEILDIIAENNDDVRTNRYLGMMEQYGLIEHAGDMIQDQTIKYYHQPEHIASGFYTSERRIIPLKDKLLDLTDTIGDLQTEVYGAVSSNIIVTLSDSNNTVQLKPNIINKFRALAYDNNDTKVQVDDDILPTVFKEKIHDMYFAYSQLTLSFYNGGDYAVKFHTIFPGDYNSDLNSDTAKSKYDVKDYIITHPNTDDEGNVTYPFDGGVYMQFDTPVDESDTTSQNNIAPQRLNQFIYFRTNVDGTTLYSPNKVATVAYDIVSHDETLSGSPMVPLISKKDIALESRPLDHILNAPTNWRDNTAYRAAYLLPYPGELSSICIPSNETFIKLEPGESILLPLSFYYWFYDGAGSNKTAVTREIAFDVRNSLFSDPVTYKLKVVAYKTDTSVFKTKSETDLSSLPSYNLTAMKDLNLSAQFKVATASNIITSPSTVRGVKTTMSTRRKRK